MTELQRLEISQRDNTAVVTLVGCVHASSWSRDSLPVSLDTRGGECLTAIGTLNALR